MKHTFILLLAAILALPAIGVSAQDADFSDLPEVTSFYPGKRDDNPTELRLNNKAYIYFAYGSKPIEAKARMIQDGAVVGTLTYAKSTMATTLVMNPADEANAAINLLVSGEVKLEFYELTYTAADNTDKTYSDINAPYADVTYTTKGAGGKLVWESTFPDNTIDSYYPAGSEGGIKTYTFDKAIKPDNLSAHFEYGQGENYLDTPLPCSLSDDGLTVTVDLRGTAYTPEVLAPGLTFVDDSGNPCDPPAIITLVVRGLECTDGSQITYVGTDITGEHSFTISGYIHQNYHYNNLTFKTPVLKSAEFYSSSDPSQRFMNISAATDMMDLTVEGAEVIQSAKMVLEAGNRSETIPYDFITVDGDTFTVCLPSVISESGASGLIVCLIDVVYKYDDGVNHVISPLDFSNIITEITALEMLNDTEANTEVVINLPDGLLVTFSNDMGYTFAEDATKGIQVMTEDYSQIFPEGARVRGRIFGTWLGSGLFMVDKDATNFTAHPDDVTTGTVVNSLEALSTGDYDFRLVTYVLGVDSTIDNDSEFPVIDGILPVMTEFIENFTLPEVVTSVTGIYYNDPSMGTPMLLPRSMDDFNLMTGISTPTVALPFDGAMFDITGRRVANPANAAPGIYIRHGRKILVK